jgi:hypothetical protein
MPKVSDPAEYTHRHPKGGIYKLVEEQWWLLHNSRWVAVTPQADILEELWANPREVKEALHGEPVTSCKHVPQAPAADKTDEVDRGAKYVHTITNKQGESIKVDIYDVLRAWNVTDPAQAHGLKKQLQPGLRGSKSIEQDLEEGLNSLQMHLHHVKQGVAG